jgi:hypothetical protein
MHIKVSHRELTKSTRVRWSVSVRSCHICFCQVVMELCLTVTTLRGSLRAHHLSASGVDLSRNLGGTNPWRALEILKNDKNLGGQPVLASPPQCKFWGDLPPPRDLRPCCQLAAVKYQFCDHPNFLYVRLN